MRPERRNSFSYQNAPSSDIKGPDNGEDVTSGLDIFLRIASEAKSREVKLRMI